MKYKQRGFTLIELLIALVIVGLLAKVGFASYTDHLRKARRADAQAALLDLSQFMERVYTENNTYKPGGSNPTLPYTEAPRDGSNKYYNLTINASTATSYTLRATPKNAQNGDGILQFSNTGAKGWDRNNDGDCSDSGENGW